MNLTPTFRMAGWTAAREGRTVFGPVELELRPGEVTTLLGPSGVGKTSLLLTFLGFNPAGVVVGGQRFENEKLLSGGEVPHGDSVFIPQHLPMNPNWELESYLCRLAWGHRAGWNDWWPTTPSRRQRVREVLAQLGIGKKARATIAELSGGEIQRAAVAQLLLLEPKLKLFVADEFVAALDPGNATWILDQCRAVITRTGATAMLALHDVHAALHISDQIALFWPNQWVPQPWVLRPKSPLWDSCALYSLLCLAKWIQDLHAQEAIHRLLALIKTYPGSLEPFIDASRDGTDVWLVQSDSSPIRLDEPMLKDVCAQGFHLGEDPAFQPVRLSLNGAVAVGITLREPRTGKMVTLIAKVATPHMVATEAE
jgi:NitT/TauT family transport system ATP-binding protein